jgi:hypothetical protein
MASDWRRGSIDPWLEGGAKEEAALIVLLLRVSSIDLTRAKRRAWRSRVDIMECILDELNLRVERELQCLSNEDRLYENGLR